MDNMDQWRINLEISTTLIHKYLSCQMFLRNVKWHMGWIYSGL